MLTRLDLTPLPYAQLADNVCDQIFGTAMEQVSEDVWNEVDEHVWILMHGQIEWVIKEPIQTHLQVAFRWTADAY